MPDETPHEQAPSGAPVKPPSGATQLGTQLVNEFAGGLIDAPAEWGEELEPTIDLGARQLKRQALDSLFARAMSGLLPRSRALKSWEPSHLDERHLNAVLLRAGGMMQGQIARFFGWTDAWTSIVLNHPDAQYVLTRIVSFAADNVIDMETRIHAYAPEALDKVVEVMRTTSDEKVASKNAFELLKMAGYGAKTEGVSVNVQVNQGLPSAAIMQLGEALKESRQIQEVTYELPQPAPSDASALAESGQLDIDVAPPIDGHSSAERQAEERKERVA